MASFKRVNVTLPDDKRLTAVEAKDIIGAFLPNEWPSVDPSTLTISRYTSFSNTHCAVKRPPPTSAAPSEPLNVFVRIHRPDAGALAVFEPLLPTRNEEADISYEYGRSGPGAKVYGAFQTQDGAKGRIDEFLDARTLEPSDVEDATIRSDIAKGLATFHTRSFSLAAKPTTSFYDAIVTGLNKYCGMAKLKRLGHESGVNIDALVDYDFAMRVKRATDGLEAIGAKSAWCLHDVQYMNVMVRNAPQHDESKTVLIDFETVMRNYRALDIGGHFMQKLFKWFDEESKIANCRPYNDEEKRHFCHEYAMGWNARTNAGDTGNQVYAEAEYGYLLALSFDIHNMLCFMDDADDKDALNLQGLNKLFEEFDNKYTHLGL